MSTYAIGDIQGCFVTLQAMLGRIRFDDLNDRLWLVGDLVNRGPDSLAVLRWARELSDRVTMVLGNHDLRLLEVAAGLEPRRNKHTFHDVLDASDADDLLLWLGQQPLAHREGEHLLIHAGLLPRWSWDETETRAREAEAVMRDDFRAVMQSGNGAALDPRIDRARQSVATFTRLRLLTSVGEVADDFSGPPEEAPPGMVPWFDHPDRVAAEGTIIFGHWSALGRLVRDDLLGLDTGCVWGGSLTAVRLDDRTVFSQPSLESKPARW